MSVGAVVCASVALLIALVASAGAWLGREKLYQGGVNAAWLGLVGAMGAIWAGQATGGAAALSVAALAATAALPAAGAAAARHRAAASGAAIPLTLAVAALIWAANTTLAPLHGVESPLILAGQLGAMGAGLTLLWCALGRGAGAAALGLIGAAALWGNTRADVAGQGFTLALATDGGPVTFALPAELGGAAVLGLQAAAPAPMLNGLLAGLALMVVAASVWGAQRERLWLLIGVVAAGAAGALLWAGYSPVMPDLEPYRVWANALGAERKLPEQALAQLGLQHSGKVFVRWVEVLPALSALLALAITALGAGLRGASDDALLARDWLLRAVALVGLSVASGMFVAWRQLGAWGTGAPGEWIALGLMGVGVGGLMMVWRAPDLARRVFAGVWAAMLVAAILAALAFGAPFAVSVRL